MMQFQAQQTGWTQMNILCRLRPYGALNGVLSAIPYSDSLKHLASRLRARLGASSLDLTVAAGVKFAGMFPGSSRGGGAAP